MTVHTKNNGKLLKKTALLWGKKLHDLDWLSGQLMEHHLQLLQDNENDLAQMILEDSKAFMEMNQELEDSITVLTDQIQFTEAIHQLTEERLD